MHLRVPGQVRVCTSVPVGSPAQAGRTHARMFARAPGHSQAASLGTALSLSFLLLGSGKALGAGPSLGGLRDTRAGGPGLTAILLGLCLCSGDTDMQKSRVPRDPELHPQHPP